MVPFTVSLAADDSFWLYFGRSGPRAPSPGLQFEESVRRAMADRTFQPRRDRLGMESKTGVGAAFLARAICIEAGVYKSGHRRASLRGRTTRPEQSLPTDSNPVSARQKLRYRSRPCTSRVANAREWQSTSLPSRADTRVGARSGVPLPTRALFLLASHVRDPGVLVHYDQDQSRAVRVADPIPVNASRSADIALHGLDLQRRTQ